MKRILYAWELGGGLGHINAFLPIARALEERGCVITWVLREPGPAAVLLEGRGDTLWDAPYFTGQIVGLPEPQLSFSEILLRRGYMSADMLTPLLRDWRAIVERAEPDLVIADFAPTALLAARSLKRTCVRIGTGFCCPPPMEPEPPLMPWLLPAPERSAESRQLVLSSINTALAVHGVAPLAVQGLMHLADDDIVTSFPDLDHYTHRGTPHWGVVLGGDSGVAPVWPEAQGPRVFAYLKAQQAQTLPLLHALRRRGCAVLAYCPGLPDTERAQLEGAQMRFSDRPVAIEAAVAGADLVICGGGHGTVCAALLGGKPLLVAPDITEQGITAHKVTALGAGLMLLAGEEGRIEQLSARLLSEPGFTRAAQEFSRRHTSASQKQIVDAIAARCVQLAGWPTRAAI
ncbi:MAG TPA: nucleotide disphospho-sugar-binding domain-containing protein [Burkholderiales bacterium]|nr:nucleotide disphospho-sugar-binding domain-containing protein [Burkholderiales bacterium]